MITGFNTDIPHEGVTYHVQTEDKGLDTPLILSLVYVGGAIIAAKRTPYQDLVAGGFDESVLAERLQRQHKLICAAIRAGRIEELKRMSAGGAQQGKPAAAEARPPSAKAKTQRKKKSGPLREVSQNGSDAANGAGEDSTATPPTSAREHSPNRNACAPKCNATNDDEHAVSTVSAGPSKPNA